MPVRLLTFNIEVEVKVMMVANRGQVVEEVVQGERVLENGIQGKLKQLTPCTI